MGTSVLITSMVLQMKQSFARPMFRFCLIANPILNTILLYEMFRNSGEENFASYVILGAGLMGIWSCICFSSAGDINRERYSGTLSLVFAAPAGFSKIIMGKIMGNTLLSLASLMISLITAVAMYRTSIVLVSPGYFAIAFVAMIASFVIISSILACLLTLSTLYMNCIEIPFVLLCGLAFPIDVLPQWIRPVSYLLAPTWAVELLRMSVAGIEDVGGFWWKLGVLVVLSLIGCACSAWLYKKIDKQVRIHASLEVC